MGILTQMGVKTAMALKIAHFEFFFDFSLYFKVRLRSEC